MIFERGKKYDFLKVGKNMISKKGEGGGVVAAKIYYF